MKKAQFTIYLFSILIMVVLVLIAAVIAPFGVTFTTEMYRAGEQIFLDNNATISSIQNTTIRDSIYNTVGEARGATETNIDVLSDMFQYGWVIILILVTIVTFLYARQLVEFQGGGGFVG